jgi:hypothetical protein
LQKPLFIAPKMQLAENKGNHLDLGEAILHHRWRHGQKAEHRGKHLKNGKKTVYP